MCMSKRKNKNKRTNYNHEQKYMQVVAAISYFLEIDEAETNRQMAQRKAQRFLKMASFVGATILLALIFVTSFNFDFSWMGNIKEWFSELYISLYVYVFITGAVLFLERSFRLDQKPWFGYTWPFVSFFISMLISKTMTAYIVPGEFNVIAFFIALGGLMAFFIMSSSVKMGKEKANNENTIAKKAKQIIEDNPEIVDEVIGDFEASIDENEKDEN